MPKLNEETDRLHTIPGVVPSSIILQKGCRFHNRCLLANEVCRNEEPEMEEIEKDHGVRCFHYEKMNKVRQLSNTKQYDNLLLNKY
jgi:oligopeptide/dipeptide ABC transporter ATP-binding protein